jgi:hypothetical protein
MPILGSEPVKSEFFIVVLVQYFIARLNTNASLPAFKALVRAA